MVKSYRKAKFYLNLWNALEFDSSYNLSLTTGTKSQNSLNAFEFCEKETNMASRQEQGRKFSVFRSVTQMKRDRREIRLAIERCLIEASDRV